MIIEKKTILSAFVNSSDQKVKDLKKPEKISPNERNSIIEDYIAEDSGSSSKSEFSGPFYESKIFI